MKQKIKNFILNLNIIRRFLGYSFFKLLLANDLSFKIKSKPPKGKVLVLSPHPDDDVFGCGGAINLHFKQKDKVYIVYLTSGKSKEKNTRQKETRKSAKILGVKDLFFLNFKDGNLSADERTTRALEEIILKINPNIIYVPSFLDSHNDHLATAQILFKILERIKFKGLIFNYEIWSPIYTNFLLKIDGVVESKTRAIKAHQSQLKERNYLKGILGLNQYRAQMFGASDFAEGFFVCNSEIYLKIGNRFFNNGATK